MKDSVVVSFRPFAMDQKVFVIKNGKIIYETMTTMSNMSSVVASLRTRFDLTDITLCGNQEYLKKFQAEFMTEFGINNTNITIVDN